MPALQVRDFPQDLYDGLKASAAADHRSLAQQTVYAVEQMLAHRGDQGSERRSRIIPFDSIKERQERIAKRKALFAQIREHAKDLPDGVPSPEVLVREARDELEERGDRIIALVEGLER